MKDEAVVRRFLETHESGYFDTLYERYADKVYGKCISMLKSESLAEDATQEVFVKVLMNISRFKGNSKFSTWVYAITYNYCIDFIRKKKRSVVEFEEHHEEESETIDEISDKELLEIEIDRLGVILDEAREDDRAILLMKYADGLSIDEMSEITGKSSSAVKMNIMRAKHRVKRIYNEMYDE